MARKPSNQEQFFDQSRSRHAMPRSAAYQTPRVFGVRVVMVPAYALIVALKILCCVNLFMDKYRCEPSNVVALSAVRMSSC